MSRRLTITFLHKVLSFEELWFNSPLHVFLAWRASAPERPMRLQSWLVRPIRGQTLSDWQLGLWDINSVLPSKYVRGEAGYWLVTTLHRATLPPRHTNVLTPGVSNLCWENILTTNDCICNAASSLHGTVMRKSGYIHSIFLTPYRDIVWLSVTNEVMMAAENQGEVFISADHPALATERWDMGRGQLVTSSSDANFYFPGCCHFSLINLNP